MQLQVFAAPGTIARTNDGVQTQLNQVSYTTANRWLPDVCSLFSVTACNHDIVSAAGVARGCIATSCLCRFLIRIPHSFCSTSDAQLSVWRSLWWRPANLIASCSAARIRL